MIKVTNPRWSVSKQFTSAAVVAGVCAWFGPALALVHAQNTPGAPGAGSFQVEEATIDDLHRAIQDGRTTCTAVVRAYVERARAYNGSCTLSPTKTGRPLSDYRCPWGSRSGPDRGKNPWSSEWRLVTRRPPTTAGRRRPSDPLRPPS